VPWLFEMTLVVSMLMAPAVLYLSFRLYYIFRQVVSEKWWLKILLPILLCSFYMFPLIGLVDFYSTGGIEVLKYPKPLTYWFWFGLVFVFQLATWVIIADLIKLVARFLSWDQNRITGIHYKVVVALIIVIFSYTGFKVYSDTTGIKTQKITLQIDQLPNTLNGFKIIHITDLQGDEYTGREEIARYIQKANDQNPDLIVFTGDLISYGTDFIKMSAEEFGKSNAKYGTYAVVGDHDYWAGLDNIEPALAEQDIPLLQDENQVVHIDSTLNIVITGITEVYSKDSDPAVVDSLTNSAQDAAVKIMASHQVKDHLISSAQNNGYDMLLAGHTHGGQVRVPFMGMSFSASERETEYVSGLYREEDLSINVNNGLGFTLAPIRYNAPPNISVIKLEAKKR
jgi:predicted MPP superfamily phosphohydrolase